ncbi:hypothetical protein AMS68_001435 [Peltaster fructicola]|uniref:Uncharacterized protein n=1 Tax=Peltaster fructicola TaxID=286661 RepID=A0A6H0XMR9_9PEZI|nr:hypothetical protein AMS68_001435 [Peltaster fructicola]
MPETYESSGHGFPAATTTTTTTAIRVAPTDRAVSNPKQQPRKRTLDESEEWILFSPNADTASRTATSQTPRTATQLSDFGSLETHIRSQARRSPGEDVEEYDDENEELDSLDDGLHAFQHHPFSSTSLNQLDQSGGTVLPTHDGLGTFSAPGMQNQMWQFERHNPNRRQARKSGLQQQIDEAGEHHEVDVEDERMARIEEWRIEQGRAVLEEIERETRRRRRKMSRMGGVSKSTDLRSNTGLDSADEHHISRPPTASQSAAPPPQTESWWARITRRVIREIIGIDDTTLSVLFGDSLPDSSPTPTQSSPIAQAAATESRVTFNDPNYGWELKLLERIARELGILVGSLPNTHEGAFSTYVGHEASSEEAMSIPVRELAPRQQSLRQQRRHMLAQASSTSDIAFTPTLPAGPLTPGTEADTSLWGIEEEPEETYAAANTTQVEQRHWQRDIDLPSIFTVLRRHFSQTAEPASQQASGPLPAAWATESQASALGTSPESLARAESIRRQHPLVHRAAERAAAQQRRREAMLRKHQMTALVQRARGSSCASHSTKRSRRTLSGSSSRHYWDIGGNSVDSEAAFSAGAAGNWGEV